MKILVCNKHPQDALAGSETQSDMVASYLHRFGHDVVYGVMKPKRKDYDTPYRAVPVAGPFSLRALIRRERPDVVYWRFNKNSLLTTALFCRLQRSPLVFTISHINDIRKWIHIKRDFRRAGLTRRMRNLAFILKQKISARINHMGYHWIDGLLSVTDDFLKKLPAGIPDTVKRKRIYSSVKPTTAENFLWKRPYVVWVANVKKAKNPEQYIGAAARARVPGVDFLLVGAIQEPSYAYIRDCEGLPDNLHYLGPQSPSRVAGILKGARFLVHTCNPEGFPNVFLQAWWLAKPVVSLNYDPDGLIEKEGIGFFSRTPAQMDEHIQRLLEDDRLRRDMGERAAAFARDRFDAEKNQRAVERFLLDIAGPGGGGSPSADSEA